MKENIRFFTFAFFAVISLFASTATVTAQDAAAVTARVDEFIKAEMLKQKIPGVSLAVVRNGEIVYAKGYGYANVEHQVPVKPETVFQSGSVGKQFTAMAIMMLVEEGKIGLDDKINKYFSDAPAEWNNVTVRHLLSHTSGMTDYPKDFDFRADYTEADIYKRIKTVPLGFQPGEKWAYSNLGYVTLGILINRVTGKFYGDFLKERVFGPLGMTTARIITESDIVPNRAAGYVLDKGELRNQPWVSPTLNTTADGALYLTVYDMAKWDQALYGEKLVKKPSLDAMWTPVKLNGGAAPKYGFGWFLAEAGGGKRIIEHGGAWQGFKAMITRVPEEKLSVIVFANLSNASERKLTRGVLEIYNPQLAPAAAKIIEDKEPQVTAFAREILQKTVDEKLTPELFTPEAAAPILGASKQVADFLKSLGALGSMELLSRTEQNAARIYRYRLSYPGAKLVYTMVLTKDDKIAGLQLRPE